MGKKPDARNTILTVFRGMVLSRPYEDITVRDIVAEAGVARSTFYDHYPDKRAVLLASMDHILNTLAACAAGSCERADIELLVLHLWQNRSFGRKLFSSSTARHITTALADVIQAKTRQSRLASTAIAHGYVGSLAGWFSGEIRATPEEMTDWLAQGRGQI